MSILFLVAMEYEIKNIFNLKEFILDEKQGFNYYRHIEKRIFILETGVGKVNAAAKMQWAINSLQPDQVINVGLTGACNEDLLTGNVYNISKCRFFDVDVTSFGFKMGQIYECKVAEYILEANSISYSRRYERVTLVSGDVFITDKRKLESIIDSFHPDCIDMELAAIAHTLYVNKKLHLLQSFKVVSDYANNTATEDFTNAKKNVFKEIKLLVQEIIKSHY